MFSPNRIVAEVLLGVTVGIVGGSVPRVSLSQFLSTQVWSSARHHYSSVNAPASRLRSCMRCDSFVRRFDSQSGPHTHTHTHTHTLQSTSLSWTYLVAYLVFGKSQKTVFQPGLCCISTPRDSKIHDIVLFHHIRLILHLQGVQTVTYHLLDLVQKNLSGTSNVLSTPSYLPGVE
jgi:hypothetical protein